MNKTPPVRSILFGATIDYQLRYHDGLYQLLADAGWEVHLVAGSGPIGNELARYPGITVHVMRMARNPSPISDLRSLRRWLKLLRTVRPAVVIVGTPKAGLLGGLAARITSVQTRIYELHGLRLESATGVLRKFLRLMEKVACSVATNVIAVGPSLRQKALDERLVSAAKIDVLGAGSPNGVHVDRYEAARSDDAARAATRKALGIPADAPLVVFVGRLTADKGLDALTDAMVDVEANSTAQLLIVGAADDDTGRVAADRLKMMVPRVTFTGVVEDVAPYLVASDVFCLPSRREGLPTVVLEAFAAGIPVVATEATGIVDIVAHGRTGRLVPIDSGNALGEMILTSLRDRAGSHRMASAARDLVRAKFASSVVQTGWMDMLEHIAKESQAEGKQP